MVNPRTRYGLTALVCCSASLVVFVATATRYNPTFEGSRIEALALDLSHEVGRRVRGRLSARERSLILELSYTPSDELYLREAACLLEMKDIMELAAIRFTGFADRVLVRAVPAESVPLIGDIPESRDLSETVAELRRRFDREQILESGNKLWPVSTPEYVPWQWMVIHHSGGPRGSAEAFDRWHRQGRHWEGGLGYHFVIGNGRGSGDGQIEAGSRWTGQLVGAHAASPNNQFNQEGIGVCLVGDFSNAGELSRKKKDGDGPAPRPAAPSERQMASLRFLVLYLTLRLEVPPERIIGHRDVPKARTICPGGNFPMGEFVAEVRRDLERLRENSR